MSQWFIINDLPEFTDKARAIVYNNFGAWRSDSEIDLMIDDVAEAEKEEFDKILSYQESIVIVSNRVKKQRNKKTNDIIYLLDEEIFALIVEELNDRMVSNIINRLVKKGLVESAFDSESNDFVFWVKEDEKEKPETD